MKIRRQDWPILRSPTPTREEHGSVSAVELASYGLSPASVIDFSASINPLGPPPGVLPSLQHVDFARYPDAGALRLRELLAARSGVPLSHVLVTAGATEAIWLLAQAVVSPGAPVLVAAPTFSEYRHACRQFGAKVIELWHPDKGPLPPQVSTIAAALSEHEPVLAFLCDPNNPSGTRILMAESRTSAVLDLMRVSHRTWLVIDEAFAPFAGIPERVDTALFDHPVILVRSLTKTMGLAGLRIGCVVASPHVIEVLEALQMPWSVSSAAEAAACAALADEAHWLRTLAVITEGRQILERGLIELGLSFIRSEANFMLITVGDGARAREQLLKEGVVVRDCSSFGLPTAIRVGIRTQPECHTLLQALQKLIRGASW